MKKQFLTEDGTDTKNKFLVGRMSAASHSTTGNAEEMLDDIHCATIATLKGKIIQFLSTVPGHGRNFVVHFIHVLRDLSTKTSSPHTNMEMGL